LHKESSIIWERIWIKRMWFSWILGVSFEGTDRFISEIFESGFGDFPVKDITFIPFSFAFFAASITFSDFPDVDMQIRISSFSPSASTCLLNTSLKS